MDLTFAGAEYFGNVDCNTEYSRYITLVRRSGGQQAARSQQHEAAELIESAMPSYADSLVSGTYYEYVDPV
jgi:hypothetical protein